MKTSLTVKEHKVTSLRNVTMAGLAIAALMFSGILSADNEAKPLQLAQLTD